MSTYDSSYLKNFNMKEQYKSSISMVKKVKHKNYHKL